VSAIYQKARPLTFEQVIGQEHVKDILLSALKNDRIGHAYLFSGPRGVGKTTTARLLAMAVNCENENKPCGKCESCRLIRAGNHPDVIELDAASNNSVEDIRDLREKVMLASMRGGKRVWVLDEAHMLSRAASNALLKTLEEPPENLVFILATTEPEKLPATILSRCQHFRFRRLSEDEIKSKLVRLCQEAGVEADDEALLLVAKTADGAMRDAESFLERLLASGEKISFEIAEDALGLPPQEQMQKLANYLAKQDLKELLPHAAELYHAGFAPSSLLEQLIKTLREALANKVLENDGFTLPLEIKDQLRMIHALDDESERFTRRDNLFGLELALIKALNTISANRPADQVSKNIETTTQASKAKLPDFDPHSRPKIKTSKPVQKPATAKSKISWYEITKNANVQLKAYLAPVETTIEGNKIILNYTKKHKFHFNQLKQRHSELLELIQSLYGDEIELVIQHENEILKKKRLTYSKPGQETKTTKPKQISRQVAKESKDVKNIEAKKLGQSVEESLDNPNDKEGKVEALAEDSHHEFKEDLPDFFLEEQDVSLIDDIAVSQAESFDSAVPLDGLEHNPKPEKTSSPATKHTKSSNADYTKRQKQSGNKSQGKQPVSDKGQFDKIEHPLFAEIEKLFPGKIIKVEKNSESSDEF